VVTRTHTPLCRVSQPNAIARIGSECNHANVISRGRKNSATRRTITNTTRSRETKIGRYICSWTWTARKRFVGLQRLRLVKSSGRGTVGLVACKYSPDCTWSLWPILFRKKIDSGYRLGSGSLDRQLYYWFDVRMDLFFFDFLFNVGFLNVYERNTLTFPSASNENKARRDTRYDFPSSSVFPTCKDIRSTRYCIDRNTFVVSLSESKNNNIISMRRHEIN